MENTHTIYLAIGAFLLGMLFIAFLLKSILGSFGRTQQVIPTGGYHNYPDESSGTIMALIFMVVVGSLVYFYSRKDLPKNQKENDVAPNEALIKSTLEQGVDESPYSDKATTEDPIHREEEMYEEDYQADETSGRIYLQLSASSNYDRILDSQDKLDEEIESHLETHVAQGDDEKYRLVLGPFDTRSGANKVKVKYGGYVIEDPDYKFLN